MTTYTDNLELVLQASGENNGTWGDPVLNQQMIARIDATMGGVTTVALTNSNVTLTQTQWRAATIKLTGALSGTVSVLFPLNVNSATVAVGGERTIDNQCTGNFTVTIKTAASGSTGVVVPQGVHSKVYSDTANVAFSDDRLGTADIGRMPTCAGTPNGSVTGVAGTAYKPTSVLVDRTNTIIYVATADGTSSWVPQSGYFPEPQGYLTLVATATDSINPIPTSDVIAATAVYYRPYKGNLLPIYNGSWMLPYFFSELTLTLTSSQAASQLYDVFAFLNSGTVTIGTGPAWFTATAGSCARGTGASTTQLSRVNGLLVNTVSMTATNGASTYSVGANQGTYLGSLFINSSAGQITCHRSWGQNRKWGVWNPYNDVPILMQAGDTTSSWSGVTAYPTFEASNANSANRITTFCGLAEEQINATFDQRVTPALSAREAYIGIGINSTTTASGTVAEALVNSDNLRITMHAQAIVQPALGINNIQSLDAITTGATFFGTQAFMTLNTTYRG